MVQKLPFLGNKKQYTSDMPEGQEINRGLLEFDKFMACNAPFTSLKLRMAGHSGGALEHFKAQ